MVVAIRTWAIPNLRWDRPATPPPHAVAETNMKRTLVSHRSHHPSGISVLELLAVITLIGILALIVIPRFSNQAVNAKRNSCLVNKNNIEVQCQLWLRQKNASPAADLSNIGANTTYFPEGLPRCPVDGSAYTINTTTQRVNGHSH
jgi:general secretion pathway protein G